MWETKEVNLVCDFSRKRVGRRVCVRSIAITDYFRVLCVCVARDVTIKSNFLVSQASTMNVCRDTCFSPFGFADHRTPPSLHDFSRRRHFFHVTFNAAFPTTVVYRPGGGPRRGPSFSASRHEFNLLFEISFKTKHFIFKIESKITKFYILQKVNNTDIHSFTTRYDAVGRKIVLPQTYTGVAPYEVNSFPPVRVIVNKYIITFSYDSNNYIRLIGFT